MSISSRISLEPFIANTNNLTDFSPEYLNFINDLANEVSKMNSSEWSPDTIWPYIFPSDLSTATCFSSSLYPEWSGKFISECFIPRSDIDTPAIIENIIKDLYFNYPPLEVGEIAISTYNIGSTYYVSLIKIDTFGDSPCFYEKQIAINPYFSESFLTITNDTTINGSFKVQTYDGQPIIETDNISKITSFHDKIGVNQDTYNVKGLVDIDNVSNTFISNIINQFVNPLLYSNNVFNNIYNSLQYNTIYVDIPVSFQQDVFVFKTIVKNVIERSDILFLWVPNSVNVFFTRYFSDDSFSKIQNIVNEINKMLPQINLNENTQSYNFSFIELLNDLDNSYLCSLRAKIVKNPNNLNKLEVYFVTSFLDVNDVVINKSYTKDFNNIANELSSCSRLVNFSALLINDPNIYNNLLQGNSIGSTNPYNPYFSDVINNSPYFRERFGSKSLYMFGWEKIEKENNNICLLNEKLSYYCGENASELFLPNNGYSLLDVENNMEQSYINNYGNNKNLSFLVSYKWSNGPKFSVMNIITNNNKHYTIGSGFNLSDIISESIVLKGDNTVTGNFSIVDSDTNNTIFNVDTYKKENFSLYKLGLGTNKPQSKLDIKNGGVGGIINSVNILAKTINDFNINYKLLTSASSENEFTDIIEKMFMSYNPTTDTKNILIQTNDNYYAVQKIPETLIGEDTEITYHWLYNNWKNQLLKNIIDPQHQIQINTVININDVLYNTLNTFNNSLSFEIFDWTFGKRFLNVKLFENNNQKYYLGSGINLEKLGIDINDDNVISFYKYISAYTFYVQDIQIRLNNITNIPNIQKATDYRNQQLNIYPIQKLIQYTINYNDISTMSISDLDYKTLSISNTQIYSSITDLNLQNKLIMFFNNTSVSYCISEFNEECVYNVNFEDKYNDFISVFLCTNADQVNKTYTFISFELQINTIIKSSLNLVGDMTVKGDSYFSDANNKPYVFIDTESKFFGINSLEVLNKYNTSISNIGYSNYRLSRQNAIVSSNLYPNFVAERIALGEQYIDNLNNKVAEPAFFVPLAPITLRRTSNFYSFDEMDTYATQHTTPIKNGFYSIEGISTEEKPLRTKYKYGAGITYEIKDKSSSTNLIGRSFMCIDHIDNGNIRGGFGVQVVDDDNGSEYRNILYVNNKSELQVNSVSLAGHVLSVDESGNLLFDGKKVNLSP